MKSIAIWYTPYNKYEIEAVNVELHFNFWKIPNGTKSQHKFLDIGLKVNSTKNISYLNIYFPTIVNSSDFVDIASKFIKNADLVSAIFNENYKVISEANSKLYEIRDSKGDFVFAIYKTSQNDLRYASSFNGTIVSIKVPMQDIQSYYRFRIKGNYIDSLSTVSKPRNSVLESAFSEIEMIDFRVNEIRDLNQDLLEKIRDEVLINIKKQHFFFICSNEEEVISSHQPFINCRNLENYRWKEYVDLPDIDNKVFLAYHWKDSNMESVSVLVKTKYERNNWKTITKFFLYGFIIAILIELFSNWLYDYLKIHL